MLLGRRRPLPRRRDKDGTRRQRTIDGVILLAVNNLLCPTGPKASSGRDGNFPDCPTERWQSLSNKIALVTRIKKLDAMSLFLTGANRKWLLRRRLAPLQA